MIDMAVLQKKPSVVDVQSSEYIPIRMLEIELGEPLPIVSAFVEGKEQRYGRVRCLVRLHTQPLGLVELAMTEDELRPEEYAQYIWQLLHTQINLHLQQDGLSPVTTLTADGIPVTGTPRCLEERAQFLAHAPFVSVIVPTHDRPDQLTRCLDSLLALQYPHYEIIIVDNAPATDVTIELVKKHSQSTPQIRYVREDRQGPSWARNRGIMIARGDILAFTDDDVVVDAHWLTELVRGFKSDEQVLCTTGLVLPQELDTAAQFLFEEVGGYNKGFSQRSFRFYSNRRLPLHPYIAERFGTGASMALKADYLREIGGFDPALGRVGPVRCSQDIALFFQVLASGATLVYTPASIAYHLHRRDYNSLCRQTFNHSVGYTAYLTKSLSEHPGLLPDFLLKLPYALLATLGTRFTEKKALPLPEKAEEVQRELITIRRKGLLYGPLAYLRSRWEIRGQYNHSLTRDTTYDGTAP